MGMFSPESNFSVLGAPPLEAPETFADDVPRSLQPQSRRSLQDLGLELRCSLGMRQKLKVFPKLS